MHINNIKDLEYTELVSSSKGEQYSLSAILSSIYDLESIFIHHEILLPGRKSSAPHFHTKIEEFCYVLSGTPTLHIGDHIKSMKAGDFYGIKPLELHYIENRSDTDAHILMICSKDSDDIVCYE